MDERGVIKVRDCCLFDWRRRGGHLTLNVRSDHCSECIAEAVATCYKLDSVASVTIKHHPTLQFFRSR